MSIVSSCPECSQPVTLPAAQPEARVRCPRCSSEFELRRALELAPPMLQLLDEPASVGNGFAVAPALSAAAMEHANLTAGFSDAVELGTLDEPLAADARPDEELDTELEHAVPSLDDLMADTADFPGDTGQPEDDPFAHVERDAQAFDADQISFEEPSAEASPFAATAELPADTAVESENPHGPFAPSEPGISVAASALKRRKREPSLIGNLIGVVGGGVVGCSLAYFIVLWIGGPPKDFLEIAPKLPKWMLPASFDKPAAAAVTPMATNPTAADLNEVKQAVAADNEPKMKINVPELPDKPAGGEDLTNAVKLPYDTEPATPEDLANELSAEPGIGAPAIDVPNPIAKTPAKEPPQEEPQVPVFKQPVTYTASDLENILADVNQLADQVAAGEPTRKQLMAYYRKLYRLGEVVTFATNADAAKQQVHILLAKLAADPSKLTEIGRNGAGFFGLDPTKQGEDKGVLLAGTVETSEAVGNLHRITLMPSGSKKTIGIYSAADPGLRVGSTVLALGSIINDPQAAMQGFSGDEPKIVWLGASAVANQ